MTWAHNHTIRASAVDMSQEQTITRYEGYLKLDPGNVQLLAALGDLYHRAGRFDEALGCLDRCLELDPALAGARGNRANVLISAHRFADAEQALRDLIATSPDPALLHNLGLTLFYQHRWAEALEQFEQARQAGLTDLQNTRYSASSLHQLGRIDEAVTLCKQALAGAGDDALAGYLSVLEMDSGNITEGHVRAQGVLERDPTNPDAALTESMWCIEQQDIEQAERWVNVCLQSGSGQARGLFAKGLVHMYKQEHAQSIAAIEAALQHTPGHVGTLVTLGWARFAARDIPGAERTFREAIAADGSFGEAHGGLAMTLIFQNRREEARRESQIARRLNPESLGAIWARGSLMALDGNTKAGEATVAAALQRSVTADGKTLMDHIQLFTRQQAARGSSTTPQPPQQ